jgi:hypothetical protein
MNCFGAFNQLASKAASKLLEPHAPLWFLKIFTGFYRGCCKTSVLQQQPLKNARFVRL